MTARLILFVLVLLAAPHVAAQAAGRVLAAAGEVVALRDGREVPLATGSIVLNGDVVRTGDASAAQIRFTDETLVALRAKSRFVITNYRFTGSDDGVSTAVYDLLQGGLRTLSGLIGRDRRDRYFMKTPLATVGIRGTAYTLVLCSRDCLEADGTLARDGAYGVVFDGRVAVANDAGTVEFGIDEAFFVADARTPAQPLIGRPGFLRDRQEARARREQAREAQEARREQQVAARDAIAARVAEARAALPSASSDARPVATLGTSASPIIVVSDLNDPDGNVALLGSGLGAGVALATVLDPVGLVDGGRGTVIELDGDRGLLERFVFNGGLQSGERRGAAVVNNGKITGDGGATWGRWVPGASVTSFGVTGVPSTGVHFFFGNLTPESLFGTLPSSAVAVRYDVAGGTNPTNEQGQAGQFLSGLLTVNFLQRSLGGELTYRIGDYTFKLPVPNGTAITTGRGFAGFNVEGRNAGGWQCACSGATGTLDRYSVSGLFLGSRAQGIGVSYGTVDAVAGRTAGVAVFRCTSGGCR